MPFNGSGVFSVVIDYVNDAANGIKILASRQMTNWNDVATNGLTNCITKDGQSTTTAAIPFAAGIETDTISPATANGPVLFSAGQIEFPAVQNPSANANTLDDYEEDVWTPEIIGNVTPGTVVYTEQDGSYTKIGRLVTAQFSIITTSITGIAGSAFIANLPVAAAELGTAAFSSWGGITLAAGYTSFSGEVSVADNQIALIQNSVNGLNGAFLTANTTLANAIILRGFVTYQAAT
jgi:hypothetical protein